MKEALVKTILDESELDELAGELISFSGDNNLWAFYGEMGAGKTTFIRYICRRLGVEGNVTSPTFSIVNEYRNDNNEPVFHFDFYRIEKEQEAVDIGCEEYFQSGSICMVEWPEKILNLLPHPHVRIDIEVAELKRRVTFSYE